MGLFDDLNRFLEERLDEFLRNNPHLEINAIVEQLKEQERDTLKKIINLESQERQLQQQILSLAQDIQTWHSRVKKAQNAGEQELAQKAAQREASLLHQGNLVWGQMEVVKQQIVQTKKLLQEIVQKKQEAQIKAQTIAQNQATSNYQTDSATKGWQESTRSYDKYNDPLEKTFQEWETNQELEQMKRNLGK
ncbi:MAG: TIGR04376 family protein [Gloeocapsa sp. DLM2.Bin57]|nr:MAG: TIGR04376 family protein [Gloeocapsa sp. DLM2.Bin57]